MKLKLEDNSSFKWYSNNNIWIKGYFHDDNNEFYCNEMMLSYFDLNKDIMEQLKRINGCFSLVICKDNKILLANDHVRSFPLFYSLTNNEIYVTDLILEQPNNTSFGEIEINEFLMSGYTIGNTTLLKQYKQVQPAELVIFEDGQLISEEFFFSHYHNDFLDFTEDKHFINLDSVTEEFIKRLIESVANRTIVIPLSGGYDSRYIVAGLKKYGYEKVICFTYGGKDSSEVVTARKVAEQLNYKHYIIDYTDEKMINLMKMENFTKYLSFAFNYSSLPHIQDFIALTELCEKKMIPNDSIIVPGFCGDLLGGSYMPVEIKENNISQLLSSDMEDYLLNRHFDNSSIDIDESCRNLLKKKINTILNKSNIDDIDTFISYNENFFTKHKVSKFVVNAVRMYDYFGYEWRLPLWDNELIKYWYKVPNDLRIDSYLYNKYLLNCLFKELGVNFRKKRTLSKNKKILFVRKMLPNSILKFIKKIIMKTSREEDVNNFSALEKYLLNDLQNIKPKDFNSIWAAWNIKYFLGVDFDQRQCKSYTHDNGYVDNC